MAALLAVWLTGTAGCAAKPSLMFVSQPVVDLRREPHTSATPQIHDPFEETQLLYGETVRLLEVRDGWAQVEALEQAEFTHRRRWQGYPGWVPAEWLVPSAAVWAPTIVITAKWAHVWQDAYKTKPAALRLPMGTMLRATDMGGHRWRIELVDGSQAWIDADDARALDELQALPEDERRHLILRAAERLLGDPYYWGGRSPHAGPVTPHGSGVDVGSGRVTGVDCSGLVNLSYRTVGVAVPRDAHEQFMRARPIDTLRAGDLIFLSEHQNPKRIVHVMLYAGDGQIIEGPGTGLAVRRIAFSQRLGHPSDRLRSGTVVNGQTVFFGAYLE